MIKQKWYGEILLWIFHEGLGKGSENSNDVITDTEDIGRVFWEQGEIVSSLLATWLEGIKDPKLEMWHWTLQGGGNSTRKINPEVIWVMLTMETIVMSCLKEPVENTEMKAMNWTLTNTCIWGHRKKIPPRRKRWREESEMKAVQVLSILRYYR